MQDEPGWMSNPSIQETNNMGYSHSWHGITPNADLAALTERMIAESGITICGPLGRGEPVITATEIKFNGDETKDNDYESFWLDTEEIAAEAEEDKLLDDGEEPLDFFCKTGRRPYDAVVTGVLVAAFLQDTTGAVRIGSDGSYDEWAAGIFLYERATGQKLTPGQRVNLKVALNLRLTL